MPKEYLKKWLEVYDVGDKFLKIRRLRDFKRVQGSLTWMIILQSSVWGLCYSGLNFYRLAIVWIKGV